MIQEVCFLVAEDDPALGAFLRKSLAIEGYRVDLTETGRHCLDQLSTRPYDLLLLDLTLPDMDGADLLAKANGFKHPVPAIVLTGRTQVEERIRCLDLGADDFLVKPFSFGELTARCRAALRRGARKTDPALHFGQLSLNRFERSVSCAGMPVDLTPKEFGLLEALMLRRGECCSRQELLQEVWNGSAETATNVVEVYMTHLRRKLAEAGARSDLYVSSPILTVRGLGYRLASPQVSPAPESWLWPQPQGA